MDKVWTPPEGMSPSFTNQVMWRLQCHCQQLHRQRLTQGSGQQYLSSLPSVEAGWEGGPTKPIWSHSHTRSMNSSFQGHTSRSCLLAQMLSLVLGPRLSKQCPIIIAQPLHVAFRCTKAPDASQATTNSVNGRIIFLALSAQRVH